MGYSGDENLGMEEFLWNREDANFNVNVSEDI